jgi:hypothetical protein
VLGALRTRCNTASSTTLSPSFRKHRAQFILVMLLFFTLTLPLLMLAYVPNPVLAVVLSMVTVGACRAGWGALG